MDGTVRVWNQTRGNQLSILDAQFPVIGLVLTETADRIGLRLANNNHVSILCLHNMPVRVSKDLGLKPPEVKLSAVSLRRGSNFGTNFSSSGSQIEMSSGKNKI